MQDRIYWLGFASFPGIGPGKFNKLLSYFSSAETAWKASLDDLKASKIGDKLAERFVDFRKTFSISEYEERMYKAKVSYLILNDPNYPKLLQQIKKAPFVLFYKARLPSLRSVMGGQGSTIGIVGTRKITDYGRQVTEMLTRELVDAGCVIVSGLAMGVDATAHKTTIDNGGKTIAVLGCGVDCCYPRENEKLYEEILDSGGLIVSEYGVGMAPTIGSFPSRNRIIAGLSQGIVVTEGAADSGALITAKDALESNRKVFAVPGPVTSSLSKGPYSLLKKGAIIVSSGKEILEELGVGKSIRSIPTSPRLRQGYGWQARLRGASKSIRGIKGSNKEEQRILDLLAKEDLHFDEIVRKTKIDSSKLGTILSMMEMKGMVKSLSAGFFSLN